MEKKQIIQNFKDLEMNLHRTTLGTAVKREANIDPLLKGDIEKQNVLKRSIRGLTIIHYFAFLQSYIEKEHWDLITMKKKKK